MTITWCEWILFTTELFVVRKNVISLRQQAVFSAQLSIISIVVNFAILSKLQIGGLWVYCHENNTTSTLTLDRSVRIITVNNFYKQFM